MSSPQRSRYDVLRSYENRLTSLEEDDSSGTLGQKNANEIDTRKKITQVELAGVGILGNVASVAYGTWNAKPAALISFELKFRSKETSLLRLKSAKITVTFQLRDRKSSPRPETPSVVSLYPPEKQRASRARPDVPTTNTLRRSSTSWGHTWSTRDGSNDQISWQLVEEEKGAGISSTVFLCAVVSPVTGPFQAVVETETRTASGFKLRTLPWSKDDPVLFDGVTEKWMEPASRNFEGLPGTGWLDWIQRLEANNVSQPSLYTPRSDSTTIVNSPTAVSHPHHTSSGLAYRIQGIPAQWTEEILVNVLARALELQGRANEISLLSVAKSPYPHRKGKTAVVSFVHTPACLATDTSAPQLVVPISPHSPQASEANTSLVFDTHFEGFTVLGRSGLTGEYGADIIVVPGLGGHAYGSFKERSGPFMWLQDSLPQDIANVFGSSLVPRIMTYGYDSHLAGSRSYQTLWDIGRRLAQSIQTCRTLEESKRPIVFIAHSLGGLVTKEAIIHMSMGKDITTSNHFKSIYGAIFFGVPNRGMDITSLIPMAGDQPNRRLLESIGPGSELLEAQAEKFAEVFSFCDSKIISIYETMLSPTAQKTETKWTMTGDPVVLVDRESATHGRPWERDGDFVLPLDRNHSDLVKFTRNCLDYELVFGILKDFLEHADEVIARRFLDPTAPYKPA